MNTNKTSSPPPVKGWVRSKNNDNNNNNNSTNISLSAFFQKQSNSNSIPKTYKKIWCWFQSDTGLLQYHHAGAINSTLSDSTNNNNNSNNNVVKGYQIKSVQIEQCTVEQSSSIRLEFILTNGKTKEQIILRASDETTVILWVNGLNNWKSKLFIDGSNSPQQQQTSPTIPSPSYGSNNSSTSTTPTPSTPPPPQPQPFHQHHKSDSYGDNSIFFSNPPSPPNEFNDDGVKKQISDTFLKNLISLDAVLATGKSSSYNSVKIRQLLLRHQPPLENDQTNYILKHIQQHISYLQECYNEVLYFCENNQIGLTTNQQYLYYNNQQQQYQQTKHKYNYDNRASLKINQQQQQIINNNQNNHSGGGGYYQDDLMSLENDFGQNLDIFSLLPNHLSIFIFSYLQPKQLLIACQVNRKWKYLASDNSLWLQFTKNLQTPSSIFDSTQNWKQTYINSRKQSFLSRKDQIINRTMTVNGIHPSASSSSTSTNSNSHHHGGSSNHHPQLTHTKENGKKEKGEEAINNWKKKYLLFKDLCLHHFHHPENSGGGGSISNGGTLKPRSKPPAPPRHDLLSNSANGINNTQQPHHHHHQQPQPHPQSQQQQPPMITGRVNPPPIKKSTKKMASSAHQPSPTLNGTPIVEQIPYKQIFGLSLSALMSEQVKSSMTMGSELPIPFILHKCFNNIHQYGLNEEGIFRVSGSLTEIEKLKSLFETGRDVDLSNNDVHAVAGLVKNFFKKLPHPLVTSDLNDYATAVSLHEQTEQAKIQEYKFIFDSLDHTTYSIFKSLLWLLKLVIENSKKTKMTEENMLIVIMPTLNCSPVLVTNGIKYHSIIFGDDDG